MAKLLNCYLFVETPIYHVSNIGKMWNYSQTPLSLRLTLQQEKPTNWP